jgi:hypothetical protein
MNKKIAICLSGIPKYWEKGLTSFQSFLPYADIFIHIWKIHENSEINKYTSGNWGAYNNITQIDYNKLLQLYGPKKYFIQDFNIKKEYFAKQKAKYFLNKNDTRGVRRGEEQSLSQLSMFYSLREACRLKNLHEKENNFIYDTVVRMRFDSEIRSIPDLQTFNCEDNIYIPEGRDWGGINDQFFFGSSAVMDMVCECYTFYDILVEKTNFYGPEVVFKKYLETFLPPQNIKRENFFIEINNN